MYKLLTTEKILPNDQLYKRFIGNKNTNSGQCVVSFFKNLILQQKLDI